MFARILETIRPQKSRTPARTGRIAPDRNVMKGDEQKSACKKWEENSIARTCDGMFK